MNCEQCLVRCNAECCGIVPLPKILFDKYKPVREIEFKEEIDNFIIAVDKDQYCCFLTQDFKCSVYEDRPEVCRKFGDESDIYMTCQWQDKDGRLRDRHERRRIDREQSKNINYMFKTLK